eukprot:SAG31_NODE_3046_length_4750_cov_4.985594_3_plen_353_part_00
MCHYRGGNYYGNQMGPGQHCCEDNCCPPPPPPPPVDNPPPPPPPVDNSCGGHLTDSGTLSDGSGNYNNGEDCTWSLRCSSAAQSPILAFNTFDTEANFDFVTVFDGSGTDSPQLGRFSGSSVPSTQQATGAAMTVRFTTDGSDTNDGFTASFSCDARSVSPSAEVTCAFAPGDGTGPGGSERMIGTTSTPAQCASLVHESEPTANGATYSLGGGTSCYAEFGMVSSNPSSSWQTCLIHLGKQTLVSLCFGFISFPRGLSSILDQWREKSCNQQAYVKAVCPSWPPRNSCLPLLTLLASLPRVVGSRVNSLRAERTSVYQIAECQSVHQIAEYSNLCRFDMRGRRRIRRCTWI